MISLKGIQKKYQLGQEEIHALQDINLELSAGKLTYLLGESGSGKSTLLHIIGGIDQANDGELFFGEKNMLDCSEKEWAYHRKKRIGFVFQNFNLISHLSALENVEMSMILDGKSKRRRRHDAMELLKIVGLADRAHHLPNQLSGGQKQRVAIARALANNPDIILADEPTGALDSENSKQIMDILDDISKQGKTVLVVTHSQELIDYADRVIMMKDGRIIDDAVSEVSAAVATTSSQSKDQKSHRIDWLTSMKLSLRNIRNKKWRNVLTGIGASIGIFGIVMIGALGSGVKDRISTTVDETTAKASLYIANKDSTLYEADDLKALESLEYVKAIYPYNAFQISLQADNGTNEMVSAESLVPDQHQAIYGKEFLKEGTFPRTDYNEITIPDRIAIELFEDAEKAIGEKVTIVAQLMSLNDVFQTVELEAVITGIVKGESMPILDTAGLSYSMATSIMNASEQTKDKSLFYKVIPTSVDHVEALQEKIKEKGYDAKTEGESGGELAMYVDMASIGLGMVSAISLLVSSIMIGIVLYMSVLERTKEIGILKAIGAVRADVRRIFITEGLIIGLLGGILGAAGAIGVGLILNAVIKEMMVVTFNLFQFEMIQIIIFVAFSGLLGVVASFFPAEKAAKQDPLISLGYE